MTNDYKLTKEFIKNFFSLKQTIPYHKVFLISNKHLTSKKYFLNIKDIILCLIKKSLKSLDIKINVFYLEHKKLEKMFDIFHKLFRNIEKIKKIESKVKKKFKRKFITNQSILFLEISENFFNNYDEIYFQKVEILMDAYSFDHKQALYDQITEKLLSVDFKIINDIEETLEKIPIRYENIKYMVEKKISNKLDNQIFINGIFDKKFNVLEDIFKYNSNRYQIIFKEFINIKYKNFDDVDMLFDLFKEYKNHENLTKTIIYNLFVKMEINCDEVAENLDKIIKMNYKDNKCTNYFENHCNANNTLNINDISVKNNFIKNTKCFDMYSNCLYYAFIGFLFDITKQKDFLELKLREKLCIRLINSKNVDLDEEDKFIEILKSNTDFLYVYKLQNVLEDFRKRTIINNYEIMLLKKFQWVEFNYENSELCEFDEIKTNYQEKMLRNEKKKIIWMDSLSSVEIDINGKIILISLLQYDILQKVLKNNFQKKHNSIFEKHLQILISKGLITYDDDNKYSFNLNCNVTYFLPDNHQVKKTCQTKILEAGSSSKEVLESQVMKIMKLKKNLTIDALKLELCINFTQAIKTLSATLIDLEKKGFLKIIDNNIEYLP